MSIEDERNTEAMVRFHREALDGLVRVDVDRKHWDEDLRREIVTHKGLGIIPDYDKRREYLGRLSRDMRARLDPAVKVREPDGLQRDMLDERERKSGSDLAVESWRRRQRLQPGCEPTPAEATLIRRAHPELCR